MPEIYRINVFSDEDGYCNFEWSLNCDIMICNTSKFYLLAFCVALQGLHLFIIFMSKLWNVLCLCSGIVFVELALIVLNFYYFAYIVLIDSIIKYN